MPSALPPEAAGLVALAALVLLPGLLVVRAPWTTVPALSVAFWTLSWWWIPLAGRSRVLPAALLLLAILALLRVLPKHTVPPPPGYTGPEPPPPVTGPQTGVVPRLRSAPSLLIVAVAVVVSVPWPLWPHAPGREMAFHTASTRLALWRDGLPATYEPLLPLAPFGAHAPALPTLAADVSLLSGLDPGRSVVVVALLSAGMLVIALFALLGTRLRPASAALAALLGLAAAPWPGFLAMWGEGGAVLALALGLPAAALLVGHSSRPSAVAAGMLLAAAALAQPLLAVTITVVLVVLRSSPWTARRGRLRDPSRAWGRDDNALVAVGVAAVLAAPALVRLGRALSVREALAVLGSPRGAEVVQFVTGLALVTLAALLAYRLAWPRLRPGVLVAALFAMSATVLIVSVRVGLARGQLAPGSLRALARLEDENRPLQAVCAPEELVDWVPALAGRPAGGSRSHRAHPWVPHVFEDESGRSSPPPCARRLDAPARPR
ncbi:MAG: hypothetical protein LJF15_05410 [Acidobacteria bacterium]|nr:hypothetical protein [Acidobacteriota bacterium]